MRGRLENKHDQVIRTVVVCYYNISFLSVREFYEPGSLVMEEEGAVIVGMLVGLNVIDANLCVKGEDLDSQVKCDAIKTVFTAV